MSVDEIHIEPAPEQRQAFARWGVAQTPKVRTVGPSTFAVAPGLFVDAPEEILIGALVDGHRYVSPEEDATNGTSAPGTELLGVATEDAFAAVGGDGSAPDFAPLDDAPADEDQNDDEPVPALYGCPLCPRHFETVRGRDTHRRQAHRED